MKQRKILLTFNGLRDPFNKDSTDGPILTLLHHRQEIDAVYLFYTTEFKIHAEKTAQQIREKHRIDVQFYPIELEDPIDYQKLMSELRRHIPMLLNEHPLPDYLILLSPGTPQMHASWFLLAASGEIPAHLCQTREAKYVDPDKHWGPILDIDPRASWFPHIKPSIQTPMLHQELDPDEVEKAVQAAGIVGSTETIQKIGEVVQAARYDSTIMLNGESGTGKELLARFIHYVSMRKHKSFIPVNCAAVPENLIESELFGYEKDSFTGANRQKIGLFEEAHEGTLFLDEIGDMSLTTQGKILRATHGEIQRIGGSRPIRVNVRIIAATHKNLQDLIQKGLFREDLFYRLNVVPITLPPLRERPQDIGLLADHFLNKFNTEMKVHKKFTTGALLKLAKHGWKGNIRELSNVIERAFVRSWDDNIDAADISFDARISDSDQESHLPELVEGFSLDEHVRIYRESIINKALSQAKDQSSAARLLGISSAAISKRKQKPLIAKR